MPRCKFCGSDCDKKDMRYSKGAKTSEQCQECYNLQQAERRFVFNFKRRNGRRTRLPNAYCVYDPTGMFSDRFIQHWRESIGVWPEGTVWEIKNPLSKQITTYRLVGDGPDQQEIEIPCRPQA